MSLGAARVLVVSIVTCAVAAVVPRAAAEPWPVHFKNGDQIRASDLKDGQNELAPGAPVEPVPLKILKESITARQRVNATFGEPRGRSFNPPPAYLHNGTDVRAPAGVQVFTIEHGEMLAHVDFIDRGPNDISDDYEAVLVASYRYVHVAADAKLAKARRLYNDAHVPLILPAGTRIGTMKRTKQIPPHLHLQREVNRFYHNPLERLDRWADTTPPAFPPLLDENGQESTAPEKFRAKVRLVADFDHTRVAVPRTFPEQKRAGVATPVVEGKIDILARVADALATDSGSVPTTDILDGTDNAAPASIAFSIDELVSTGGGNERRTVTPRATTIDFTDPVPFGADEDPERPEVKASAWFFRRLYFVNEFIGTWTKPRGGVVRMDYIATSKHRASPEQPPSADQFDTDTASTRNGLYEVTVTARHLPGRAAPNADLHEKSEPRKFLICNAPFLRTAKSAEPAGKPLELGDRVRLEGYNFFTPLAVPFDLFNPQKPVIELAQVTNNTTKAIVVDAALIELPQTLPASNVTSTVVFRLPDRQSLISAGMDPTGRKFKVRVAIVCNPTDSADLHYSAPLDLALAGGRAVLAYRDLDRPMPTDCFTPACVPIQRLNVVDTAESAGPRVLVAIPPGRGGIGVQSISGDGQRVAIEVLDSGESFYQGVNVYDVATGDSVRFRTGQGPFGQSPSFPKLSGNGRRVAFYANGERGSDFYVTEIRVADLPDRLSRESPPSARSVLIARSDNSPSTAVVDIFSVSISPNGRYVAGSRYTAGGLEVVRIDLEAGDRVESFGFVRVPQYGVLTRTTINDAGAIAAYDLNARSLVLLDSSGRRAIPGVLVSADLKTAIAYTPVDGVSAWSIVSVDGGEAAMALPLGAREFPTALSGDGKLIGVTRLTTTSADRMDLLVLNVETRALIPVVTGLIRPSWDLIGEDFISNSLPIPPAILSLTLP